MNTFLAQHHNFVPTMAVAVFLVMVSALSKPMPPAVQTYSVDSVIEVKRYEHNLSKWRWVFGALWAGWLLFMWAGW